MQAILLKSFGSADQMYLGNAPTPVPKSHEILVKVHATALNRADTLQRKGQYPPPPGASHILGLEMAGEVVAIGDEVTRWKTGDRVNGLLSGGGYAEYVAIPEALAMPLPEAWSYEEAAAVPEVFLTAFQAIRWIADLQKGENILIHAGASGVGTAAIQLAKVMGATPFVTASAPKHSLCLQLGAKAAIDYKSEDFSKKIMELTKGQGADVIIDFLAASYFQKNINSLHTDGRLVILALMGGINVQALNMAKILTKRLQITGSTLRARPLDYKARLVQDFWQFAAPLFTSGQLRPVIDSIYSWREVVAAHEYMEANKNQGKIVLKVAK